MPWVVLAAELAWREGEQKIVLAAIAGAMQMLAGGPEIIFLTWLFVLALWLQQFFIGRDASSPPRAGMLWRFPLYRAGHFALAAQLLPFLDLVAHSQRDTGYADMRWSMPGCGWANFLVPMAFGSTNTEGIFFQHGQYWTSSYYLGIGTLWLALLAFWARQDPASQASAAAGLTALAGLLFALGENTPVLPALRKLIPQLSLITYPIKYVAVIVFVAPLLAAFALANFQKIQKRLLPLGAALFALLAAVVIWTQLAPPPGDDKLAALSNGFSRAAFLILIGVIFFALTREAKSKLLQAAPLLLILIAWADV